MMHNKQQCRGCQKLAAKKIAGKCDSCRRADEYPHNREIKDTRSQKQIWDDFHENGFQ